MRSNDRGSLDHDSRIASHRHWHWAGQLQDRIGLSTAKRPHGATENYKYQRGQKGKSLSLRLRVTRRFCDRMIQAPSFFAGNNLIRDDHGYAPPDSDDHLVEDQVFVG